MFYLQFYSNHEVILRLLCWFFFIGVKWVPIFFEVQVRLINSHANIDHILHLIHHCRTLGLFRKRKWRLCVVRSINHSLKYHLIVKCLRPWKRWGGECVLIYRIRTKTLVSFQNKKIKFQQIDQIYLMIDCV